MIDLTVMIRKYILEIEEFTDVISNYGVDGKAIFTRRPVPEDAIYPMAVISPLYSEVKVQQITCNRRNLTYQIVVYGDNDTSDNYNKVEGAAFVLARSFDSANVHDFDMPQGAQLLGLTTTSPMSAPTDDNNRVARVVSVTFYVKY